MLMTVAGSEKDIGLKFTFLHTLWQQLSKFGNLGFQERDRKGDRLEPL
jgi:hypothetical protein